MKGLKRAHLRWVEKPISYSCVLLLPVLVIGQNPHFIQRDALRELSWMVDSWEGFALSTFQDSGLPIAIIKSEENNQNDGTFAISGIDAQFSPNRSKVDSQSEIMLHNMKGEKSNGWVEAEEYSWDGENRMKFFDLTIKQNQ